jgi:hypothetical protein
MQSRAQGNGQRIAIAAGRARAVPSAQHDRPPRPALAEGARRATAGGASRSRRDEHALCRPRDATALPGRRQHRGRDVRPMFVPPAVRRERGRTSTRCAACATRPLSPAGNGGGHAPCGPRVCRRQRIAIVAGRARAVPPARHDHPTPPQPALAEARAVWPICLPSALRRELSGTSTRCAARATQSPYPAGAGGGRAPCGPCVCRRLRIAIAAGRARAVPPARRDRPPRPGPPLAEGARRAAHVLLVAQEAINKLYF